MAFGDIGDHTPILVGDDGQHLLPDLQPVADAGLEGGDAAGRRRRQPGAVEVVAGAVARRLGHRHLGRAHRHLALRHGRDGHGTAKLRRRHVEVAAGIVHPLEADIGAAQQAALAVQHGAGIARHRLGGGDAGLGLGDRIGGQGLLALRQVHRGLGGGEGQGEGPRVDRQQRRSGGDALVLPHRQLGDGASDFRRHQHDVGGDIGIGGIGEDQRRDLVQRESDAKGEHDAAREMGFDPAEHAAVPA